MSMKKLILVMLALSPFARTVVASDDPPFQHLTSPEGIQFDWRVREATLLDVVATCATTGWVGIGFDPSDRMLDANFVLGYVDAQGALRIRDDYGTKKDAHKSDVELGGRDDITLATGEIVNGVTTLRFTIPLDSGDSRDRPLVQGKQHTLLLACAKNGKKNFTSEHQKVSVVPIVL